MLKRAFNFSSGPAMLPAPVLEALQEGVADFFQGMSILEMSHRSPQFLEIAAESEQNLRTLLAIPDDFAVLFMHGGGRGQFNAVPLNLLGQHASADYLITGHWSKEAAQEAARYGKINIVADGHAQQYRTLPPMTAWQPNDKAAYFHYTDNETIEGVEFAMPPKVQVPLVADMTSNLLTKPVDWSQFGAVYAAAQKNLGIAGITVVVVRKDLLDRVRPETPTILNYKAMQESHSLYNTPPVFAWYVTALMLRWARNEGGLSVLSKRCETHAKQVYDLIDNSDFYQNHVDTACRSRLNIPFQISDPTLESRLIHEAEQQGIWFIKGHRSVGGFRVSLYLGMPTEGVAALIAFLREFERTH